MIIQLVSRGLKYAQRASETRAARRGKQDEATFNDGFQPLHRMRSDVMEKHVSAVHPGKPFALGSVFKNQKNGSIFLMLHGHSSCAFCFIIPTRPAA